MLDLVVADPLARRIMEERMVSPALDHVSDFIHEGHEAPPAGLRGPPLQAQDSPLPVDLRPAKP